MTITVWVLVLYMSTYQTGGPAVIDNIASKEQCEILVNEIKATGNRAKCYVVEKVK